MKIHRNPYGELSSTMQAFNLINAVTDTLKEFIESVFVHDFSRGLQSEHGVQLHVMLDLWKNQLLADHCLSI